MKLPEQELWLAFQLPHIPQYQQSQLTYQDGYDSDYSDGMIGPFFDAVDDQVADDDEIFDEAEHQGVSNISPSDY